MGMNFFWRISQIADVQSLESLRDELVREAADHHFDLQ